MRYMALSSPFCGEKTEHGEVLAFAQGLTVGKSQRHNLNSTGLILYV